MSRLKSVFAIAVLIASVGAAQSAHATATLKVLMIGASGTWQAMGTGTYKGGNCPTGAVGGCAAASYGSVNVIDTGARDTLTPAPPSGSCGTTRPQIRPAQARATGGHT